MDSQFDTARWLRRCTRWIVVCAVGRLVISGFTRGETIWPLAIIYVVVLGLVLGSLAFAMEGAGSVRASSAPSPDPTPRSGGADRARYAKWIAAFVVARIALTPFGGPPGTIEILVLVPIVAVLCARVRNRSEVQMAR